MLIIAVILSLAPVIGCGDQWFLSVQNELDHDIEIRVNPVISPKDDVMITRPIEVFGTTKLPLGNLLDIEFYDGAPGSAEVYTVLLVTDSDNYFFWVSNNALLEARCEVSVTESLTNFLDSFTPPEGQIAASPVIIVDDPLILNPNYRELPENKCDDY